MLAEGGGEAVGSLGLRQDQPEPEPQPQPSPHPGFSGSEEVQQQLRRADSASELTSYSFAQIAGIMRSAVRSQVAGRARPA